MKCSCRSINNTNIEFSFSQNSYTGNVIAGVVSNENSGPTESLLNKSSEITKKQTVLSINNINSNEKVDVNDKDVKPEAL